MRSIGYLPEVAIMGVSTETTATALSAAVWAAFSCVHWFFKMLPVTWAGLMSEAFNSCGSCRFLLLSPAAYNPALRLG